MVANMGRSPRRWIHHRWGYFHWNYIISMFTTGFPMTWSIKLGILLTQTSEHILCHFQWNVHLDSLAPMSIVYHRQLAYPSIVSLHRIWLLGDFWHASASACYHSTPERIRLLKWHTKQSNHDEYYCMLRQSMTKELKHIMKIYLNIECYSW